MLQAVIFDMDGVIIDSEPAHYQVNQRLFHELAIPVSLAEYQTFIGLSNTSMWTILKSKYHLEPSVSELVDMQVKGNFDYIMTEAIEPIPGVSELIQLLTTNRIKLAIASSSPHSIINLVMARFNFRSFFSGIISGENLAHGKPAPDIFWAAAKIIEESPENCLVIEDSTNGVKAAKDAGMKCIGFQNKNSGPQVLSRSDLIIDHFTKLNLEMMRDLF